MVLRASSISAKIHLLLFFYFLFILPIAVLYLFWVLPVGLSRLCLYGPSSVAMAASSFAAYKSKVVFSDIDCDRVIANDKKYLHQRVHRRLTFNADPAEQELPVDCQSIFSRHPHLTIANRHIDEEEKQFPIAFARAVFKDYLFLEMELATNYVPQNWYCYAIDARSSELFHRRMRALAQCFPNVVITEREFKMDSAGHNMSNSLLECMRTLAARQWKYLVLLQNHNVQLKTNEEMVQVLKWLNGTNDIQHTRVGSHHVDFAHGNWTLAHLRLFKNQSKNEERDERGQLVELLKNKGQVEASLSRAFVQWLLDELNVDVMMEQLDSLAVNNRAMDEHLLPTLAANERLNAPGGFTQHCFESDLAPGITRFALKVNFFPWLCYGGAIRHNVCIISLLELGPYLVDQSPFLFVNKMMPEVDAEAIQCWHEEMLKRTILDRGTHRLRAEMYKELPQVRYNMLKQRDGSVDLDTFDCRYRFLEEIAQKQEWR